MDGVRDWTKSQRDPLGSFKANIVRQRSRNEFSPLPARRDNSQRSKQEAGPIDAAMTWQDPASDHDRRHDVDQRDRVKDWRHNRERIDEKISSSAFVAASLSLLGFGAAVLGNEFILNDYSPQSFSVNVAKTCNTVLTALSLMFLYRLHWLVILLKRVDAHLYMNQQLVHHIRVRDVLLRPAFFLEAVLCGVHVPPFVTFEIATWSDTNFILYRAETIGALLNSIRLYLLWRCIRDRVLGAFPKRRTVAACFAIPMRSTFAIKAILTGTDAVYFIAAFWSCWVALAAYWFRSAEISACSLRTAHHPLCASPQAREWRLAPNVVEPVQKDAYVANALWAMCVTTTTLGLGDIVPRTPLGRAVAAQISLVGVVAAAMLTAALASRLQWTASQFSALLLLEREKAREHLKKLAARRLAWWWQHRFRGAAAVAEEKLRRWRVEFVETMRATEVEIEDCLAFDTVVDRLLRSSRKTAAEVDALVALLEMRLEAAAANHGAAEGGEGGEAEEGGEGGHAGDGIASPSRGRIMHNLDKAEAQALQDEELDAFFEGSELSDAEPAPEPRQRASEGAEEGLRNRSSSGGSEGVAGPRGKGVGGARFSQRLSIAQLPGAGQVQGAMKMAVQQRKRQRRQAGWARNRAVLEGMLRRNAGWAAGSGLAGTVGAVVQNELVVRGADPRGLQLDLLKAAVSAATAACLLLLVRGYRLQIVSGRLTLHLNRGEVLRHQVSLRETFGSSWLWLELAVCALHLPPCVSFELPMTNLSNFVLYRAETIFCCLTVARIYLLWPVVRDLILDDLPRRHTVAALTNVDIGSPFALKRMLHSRWSLCYLACLWCSFVCVAGYLFRSTELTACQFGSQSCIGTTAVHSGCRAPEACTWSIQGMSFRKKNDPWVWNSIWICFIGTTTVGYGSDGLPTTHLGRSVLAVCGLAGIVMASLVAASFGPAVHWNTQEFAAKQVFEREAARERVREQAARIVGLWWRRAKKRKTSRAHAHASLRALSAALRTEKELATVELEECQPPPLKLMAVTQRLKTLHGQLGGAVEALVEQ